MRKRNLGNTRRKTRRRKRSRIQKVGTGVTRRTG